MNATKDNLKSHYLIYLSLFINSLLTRPQMPLDYHLETLDIAHKLNGGN